MDEVPETVEPTEDEARALLAGTDPEAYHRWIAELARPQEGSVLGSLAYDPNLSFHAPECVVVEPTPVGRDNIALFGSAAYRDFEPVLIDAFRRPEVEHLLNDLHHRLMHEGTNVALVTNHGQIIDIALVLGALAMAMSDPERSFGVLGERGTLSDFAERSNVLVSRMVTTRQAFSIPAIEVLQHFTRVFLSIPQTTSRRRARLSPELVRANNILMRHELDSRLASGGQLIAMAASGSQDLSLAANLVQQVRTMWKQRRGEEPGPAPSLHLQPLYRGTISLMIQATDVLPIALSLDPAHPTCVIGGLTRVRDDDDCHRVMEWIASSHEEQTGVNTVYHRHEDDLLEQVRAVLRS